LRDDHAAWAMTVVVGWRYYTDWRFGVKWGRDCASSGLLISAPLAWI